MKMFLAIIVSSALVQQLGFSPLSFSQEVHRPVTLDTTVRVPNTSSGSAFSDLVAVGLQNHVPLGITLIDTPDSDFCRVSLNLNRGTVTVAELIAAVEAAVPSYRVELVNGVLDVTPTHLPDLTSRFLEIRPVHFRSAPKTQKDIGYDLWVPIYGIIAPGAGTNSSHLSSLSAEKVPGIDVRGKTVKSILNLIVNEGDGGVWILNAAQLKTLSADTSMPYQIYGYNNDNGSIAANLTCSRGQQNELLPIEPIPGSSVKN